MNIIDFSVGRTGSRCDSVAFEDTLLAQDHHRLLAKGEWCWADAGYKRQDWLNDVQYACCWLRAAVLLHQAAKNIEKEEAGSDPFYAEGAEWEQQQREEGEERSGVEDRASDANPNVTRAAQMKLADSFRNALMEIVCKSKPPRVSRRAM
ncbi:hypothetical protein CF319_g8094 [Tilletia indica]|nr:hypothetical protein CF319_g8094 [Tilletia indica]